MPELRLPSQHAWPRRPSTRIEIRLTAAARGPQFVVVTMGDGLRRCRRYRRDVRAGGAAGRTSVGRLSDTCAGGRQLGGPVLKRTMSRAAGLSLQLAWRRGPRSRRDQQLPGSTPSGPAQPGDDRVDRRFSELGNRADGQSPTCSALARGGGSPTDVARPHRGNEQVSAVAVAAAATLKWYPGGNRRTIQEKCTARREADPSAPCRFSPPHYYYRSPRRPLPSPSPEPGTCLACSADRLYIDDPHRYLPNGRFNRPRPPSTTLGGKKPRKSREFSRKTASLTGFSGFWTNQPVPPRAGRIRSSLFAGRDWREELASHIRRSLRQKPIPLTNKRELYLPGIDTYFRRT